MSFSRLNLLMPKCRNIDIQELSIIQLQSHMDSESFTSADLTRCYLERIRKLNPRIKAVIETNPDALQIADDLDAERRIGKVRSKIHGVPFLVKDNIATKDKMQTTAGSAALMETEVPNDARVVALLRAAGGVLLGKANMSEWASMRATYYAEAYSSRGGQNRNPYNLAEHPGGSSSGSASGLAANMCAFSIGTETDGSIMLPGDRNAVVGIKPTVGLTSTAGVVPEAPSLDTVGPFGRSVLDAAIVLDIIAETQFTTSNQGCITATGEEKNSMTRCYASYLSKADALKGARFGLPKERVWEAASNSADYKPHYRALKKVITQIQEAGAEIVDAELPSAKEIIPVNGWDWSYGEGMPKSRLSELTVVNVEFRNSLNDYLEGLKNNEKGVLSLEDVIKYNLKHSDHEGGLPGAHAAWPTGQDGFDKALEMAKDDDPTYHAALTYIKQKSREEGIDAALKHGASVLDGLLVPLQAEQGVACSVAAKAGYPMITIPIDVGDDGVPFGLAIIQTAWKEGPLIKYGSAIENLVGPRHLPKFLNLNADNYTYIGIPPKNSFNAMKKEPTGA